MKKILLILLLGITMAGCSKSNHNTNTNGNLSAAEVPAAVISTYTTRYPAAAGQVEWEKEDGNTYKVKFFMGSQRWQAIFASDGTFITEQQI